MNVLKLPWDSFLGAIDTAISDLNNIPLLNDSKPLLSAQLMTIRAHVASKKPSVQQHNSTNPQDESAVADASNSRSINSSLPARPASYADKLAAAAMKALPPHLTAHRLDPPATGANSISLSAQSSETRPPLHNNKYSSQLVISFSRLSSDSELRQMDNQALSRRIHSSFAKIAVSFLNWRPLSLSRDLLFNFKSPSDANLARSESRKWLPLLDPTNSLTIKQPLRTHAVVVHRVPRSITEEDFTECIEDFAGGATARVENLPERRAGSQFGSRKVVFTDVVSVQTCLQVGELVRFGSAMRFEAWDSEKVRQCWKCARLGHFMSECKAEGWTCRECGGNHKTELCTEKVKKCVNCNLAVTSLHRECEAKLKIRMNPPLPPLSHVKSHEQTVASAHAIEKSSASTLQTNTPNAERNLSGSETSPPPSLSPAIGADTQLEAEEETNDPFTTPRVVSRRASISNLPARSPPQTPLAPRKPSNPHMTRSRSLSVHPLLLSTENSSNTPGPSTLVEK